LTEGTLATVAAWSYGLAAVAYFALALRMGLGWHLNARAALLLLATLATALWACMGTLVALLKVPATYLAFNAADMLRYGAWFGFVGSLLATTRKTEPSGGAHARNFRLIHVAVAAALIASVALSAGPGVADLLGLPGPRAEFGLHIGLAVFGLTLVEQLLRGAPPEARWAIKPLCIGLAGVFGFDLFFFADAMLFAQADPSILAARGIANAMIIPFIVIATARNTGWNVEMHLSRGAMFQSTALLVSGVFLVAVGAAGYYVRYLGGDWGRALQIELVFAAVLSVAVVAWSGRFRSRLKVFISKHFFSYRYDYREEWLRFTHTLSSETSSQRVLEQTITALANLVESPAGMLWLKDHEQDFRPAARWNMAAVSATEPAGGALARFLERSGWIVSVDDCAAAPQRYDGLTMPAWLASIPDAWLIVPLASGSDLLGFVILATPRAAVEIDWEVRDLLKTASRQAASYLGQLQATEALLEGRKFEAFNRMSAFVVHDLKNLIAQLSLMLRNAERHHDNPEFQGDMLATVQHVVGRMNKLMLQLRTGTTPVENSRPVDLGAVVQRVCTAKVGSEAQIEVSLSPGVVALGHEERFEHVIGHLVQNALDATADGGQVSVRLGREDGFALVEVADTGIGMSPEFVRQKLFKPFETTKPTGMGIGVYESSQYIAALGGQILFDSTPNVGTRVRILVPQADSAASAATFREVA
jgi:putative PEP-CTERM system histidine kinase